MQGGLGTRALLTMMSSSKSWEYEQACQRRATRKTRHPACSTPPPSPRPLGIEQELGTSLPLSSTSHYRTRRT